MIKLTRDKHPLIVQDILGMVRRSCRNVETIAMTFKGGNDKGPGEVNYSLPVVSFDDRFHLMLKIHTARDLYWELYRNGIRTGNNIQSSH